MEESIRIAKSKVEAQDVLPPPISWFVLFLVLTGINDGARLLIPGVEHGLILSLALSIWGIYLSSWILTISPKSTSIYWMAASFLGNCVPIYLSLSTDHQTLSHLGIPISVTFGIGSGITGVFVIRHELLKHYNDIDPQDLRLGKLETLLTHFLYFQHHLIKIRKAKLKGSVAGKRQNRQVPILD